MADAQLVQRAIELACTAHRGACDKSGVPIFFHLAYVAGCGHTDEERIVGLLHDIIEDTCYTSADLEREGFPADIVKAIKLLTRTPGEDYFKYIERVASDPLAIAVKLIDLEHNMQLGRILNPQDKDYARLRRYRQAYAHLVRIRRKQELELELASLPKDSSGAISRLEEYTARYQHCHLDDFLMLACVLEQILGKICLKHAPLGIVQSRAKSTESFRAKCSREGKNYADPLRECTDLAAARVIVTTIDELKRVAQVIADLFEGEVMEDITPARYSYNQFGYASVHFDNIVVHEPVMAGVDTRMEFTEGLRAEIQVRTICQHQYAVFTHDRVYKSNAYLDQKLQRKLSRMAAILEEVDDDFDEMVAELDGTGQFGRKAAVENSWLVQRCCPSCPHSPKRNTDNAVICDAAMYSTSRRDLP